MKRTLSVFFNIDRTYVTITEPNEKGIELLYLNSTDTNIDLENLDDDFAQVGIEDLEALLKPIEIEVDRICVTIPAESVLVSQFPGRPGMEESELRKLVSLEIRNAYPTFNPDDFTSNVIPLAQRQDGQSLMLAVIMPKQIIMSCIDILKVYDLPIENIEISQLNAHSAFLYNYPEMMDKNVIIIGVQDQFMDVSVISAGKPIYYDLVSLGDKSEIGNVFEAEYEKLTKTAIQNIDCAYFFGTGLTRDMYISVWETSMLLGIGIGRLNAFRMITTKLDSRDREYCSRTMHIYPPCIGSSFPAYHEKIKLS
ncbi:MAG: hypothetical protein NTW25_15190 [Candidatus Kapabacteria bacterium]|nr:hypothetical protein [Candidatus Kapabacteria bacterium]